MLRIYNTSNIFLVILYYFDVKTINLLQRNQYNSRDNDDNDDDDDDDD